MSSLPVETIQCPYCWEMIDVLVDTSVGQQDYSEDCSVCCRPINLSVQARGGEVVSIEARSEDD
jgi:hypothetical protein